MPTVYVIRHGIAEDASASGLDADRALTERGIQRTARVALGLARLIGGSQSPAVVLTSPLRRAVQTAELVAEAFKPAPAVRRTRLLSPGGDFAALARLIDSQRARVVALVGHEPDLSGLVGWLIAGAAVRIDFKKAAVCRIDFARGVGPGDGCLVFFATPRILRSMVADA